MSAAHPRTGHDRGGQRRSPPAGHLRGTGDSLGISGPVRTDPVFAGPGRTTRLLTDSLAWSEAGPVLDIGCGDGRTVELLRRDAPGRAVVGVDLSEQRLRNARRAAPVSVADACQLPFPGRSFQLVVCRHVIEHVDDDAALLREVHRVMAPGGLLYLETPRRLAFAWYPYRNAAGRWVLDPTHVREYDSEDTLVQLCVAAGMAICTSSEARIMFPVTHVAARLWGRVARRSLPQVPERGERLAVPVPRYRELQLLGRRTPP